MEVTIPNDEDNSNNQVTTSFNDAQEYVGDLTLTITDNWGSERTWNIKDYEGNIVANGGPYANNTTITETITLYWRKLILSIELIRMATVVAL